jgi:hypothetical protein
MNCGIGRSETCNIIMTPRMSTPGSSLVKCKKKAYSDEKEAYLRRMEKSAKYLPK